jgi:hypothetical protein
MSDSEIDTAATDFDRVSEYCGDVWSYSYSLSGRMQALRLDALRWVTTKVTTGTNPTMVRLRDADASPDVRRCDRCRRPRDNGHESLCPICLLGQRAP